MKYIKSILAVLLVCSFLVAFAACGSDNEVQNTTTAAKTTIEETAQSTVTTATKSATTAVAKTTRANQSAKRTAKVSEAEALISRTKNSKGNPSDSFVNSLKGYNLKVYYPWTPENKGSDANLKKIEKSALSAVEKEFGVTIDMDGKFDSYNETLTAKLTAMSKDLWHVYKLQYFNFVSYFKNGYMTDLTLAMAKSGVTFQEPWYANDASQFFNINNKQFGWVDGEVPNVITYNKTLIKKARLKDPLELAKEGKWTWDTLVKYALKLNNSAKGIMGFGNPSFGEWVLPMLEHMCVQQGTSLVNVKRNSSPTTNYNNQTVKNTLATLYKWCKEDGDNTICNTFRKKDWTYGKTQFASGKVAMMYGAHDIIQSLKTHKKTTDEFGVVQFPTPTGTKNYLNLSATWFVDFIPSVYKADAAKILFLRNEIYRQEYRYSKSHFTYQWRQYFDDVDTIDFCYDVKYQRGNNKTVQSWVQLCEQNGNITSQKIIDELMNSSSNNVQAAITKYKSSLDKQYSTIWSGFKITGKV